MNIYEYKHIVKSERQEYSFRLTNQNLAFVHLFFFIFFFVIILCAGELFYFLSVIDFGKSSPFI